jgi:molybdopterin adenylyltransferase
MKLPETLNILVLTLSDRASIGEYEDRSGPAIASLLEECLRASRFRYTIEREIIPDDATRLKRILSAGSSTYHIIFTTGGTGIGPRDITVDVVSSMLEKEIPGIMELIRVKYGMEKPNALLSRSVTGIIGKSLIFTLPGSVKAVHEYMTEICKTLDHMIHMQYGVDVHH